MTTDHAAFLGQLEDRLTAGAATVRIAREHGVAIVPQGGNTGLSGGATPLPEGSQIVLSLERMARIRAVDRFGMTVKATARPPCPRLGADRSWMLEAGAAIKEREA